MPSSHLLRIAVWLALMPLRCHSVPSDQQEPQLALAQKCASEERGEYRTRMQDTGDAKFIWRGDANRLQASVTLRQDKCTCTDRETIVDPVTGEERRALHRATNGRSRMASSEASRRSGTPTWPSRSPGSSNSAATPAGTRSAWLPGTTPAG